MSLIAFRTSETHHMRTMRLGLLKMQEDNRSNQWHAEFSYPKSLGSKKVAKLGEKGQ